MWEYVYLYRGNSFVFHLQFTFLFCTTLWRWKEPWKAETQHTMNVGYNAKTWLYRLFCCIIFYEMARYQEHASPRLFDFSQLYHSCWFFSREWTIQWDEFKNIIKESSYQLWKSNVLSFFLSETAGIRWHPDKDLQYRAHLMIFVLHKHE